MPISSRLRDTSAMQSLARRYPHWTVTLLAILIVSFYWMVWADDRYVSRATVVLESPQIAAPEFSFSSLLTGSQQDNDLLLLREYLLSVDMLKQVQDQLDFRQHYSEHGDLFSSLWDADAPIEELHEYYLNRVSVEMDEYSGVLNIEVQAFTPEFAHKVAELLLKAGEQHMNEMGQRLASEQVEFLEVQVDRLSDELDAARAALLAYQNEHGLVSPTGTVESLSQVVATLQGELATLQARRSALSSYASARSADVVRVNSEITAVHDQIEQERDRLAQAAGNSLNRTASEYQTLELKAQFAQEVYSSALTSLESTRIEAARKLKQVSILQSPLYPEYSTSPKRLYNASVFALVALFLAFITNMLILIVRDHRD